MIQETEVSIPCSYVKQECPVDFPFNSITFYNMIQPPKSWKSIGTGSTLFVLLLVTMGSLQELCYICVLTLAITKLLPAAQLIVEFFFSESAYLFWKYFAGPAADWCDCLGCCPKSTLDFHVMLQRDMPEYVPFRIWRHEGHSTARISFLHVPCTVDLLTNKTWSCFESMLGNWLHNIHQYMVDIGRPTKHI